jgi:DeoR family transcriptional regulator of aga operon
MLSISAARAASIQELSEAIGISSRRFAATEHLEERGYLERSHGGALIQKQLQSTLSQRLRSG